MTTVLLVCVVILALAAIANAALTAAMIRRLKALSGRLPPERAGHHIAAAGLLPARPGQPRAPAATPPVATPPVTTPPGGTPPAAEPASSLAPGSAIDFPESGDARFDQARTILHGEWLVAATMPDCEGCQEDRPVLAEVVQRRAARGERTAILIEGDAGDATAYGDLEGLAVAIIDEPATDMIGMRLGIDAYPSYLLLRDGRLERSAWSLQQLGVLPDHR